LGIYVDEEGTVFALAEKGATKAIEVERSFAEGKEAGNGSDAASTSDERSVDGSEVSAGKAKRLKRREEWTGRP